MRRLGLLIVVILWCATASMARATAPPTVTTPLMPTSPLLTQTSSVNPPATRPHPSPATSAVSSTDLPYTGDNLGPEAIAAVLLLGTGVAMSVRLRRR
jgi:hypothetical protein